MTQLFHSWTYAQKTPYPTIDIYVSLCLSCLINYSKELESTDEWIIKI